jgi:hypothetical protein
MKKSLLALFVFTTFGASAQTRISFKKTPNTLKPIVEKVARDYYQNFNNIKGDTLTETESTIEFESKVAPADAIATSITKYVDPYSYTWQATMFQSEDYEAAVE